MEKNESALERLEAVVGETAVAVRQGNLAVMGDLAARTNAALGEIGPETDVDRLESLRAKALHNIIALEAAARGVRAARRRLIEIVGARTGVQTYDIDGKTHRIGGPAGALKARL